MTLGELLLAAALASAAVALLAPRWREVAVRLHAALVLAALGLLLTDLLTGALRYHDAWDHSRADHPVWYRLAGLWGGEAGTVLLWNAVIAATLLFVRETRPRLMLLVLSGALVVLDLAFGTLRPTSAADLAAAPLGRGLADVLLTPLMVIHPPIQFMGYGLMAVPAAYALASLWDPPGDASWAARAYPWARRAWLFATLGLGLGALWAYYVLSFGGYWAWDPVETANLLPWLALTAFLHAGKERMRGHGHATSSLLLAYAAFLLTLFATFGTRSGLWVSVHAFTDPTDRFEPDAPARLLAILDAHLPTRLFLSLLGALLFLGVGLWSARRLGGRYGRAHGAALVVLSGAALLAPRDLWGALFFLATSATPLAVGLGILLAVLLASPFLVAFARADDAHAKLDVSLRTLMTMAVALLAIALAVVLLLDVQVVNGPERDTFDRRAPFLAVPIVSAVTLMLALAPLGKRGALALAGGALALGIAGAALVPGARVLALAAPLCVAGALAAILKLAHVQGTSAPRRLRVAGTLLLLASLLGLVMWSNPPTYARGAVLSDGASLALGLAGIALSALGILGAVAAFRARGRPLALVGAFGATLATGYGVGSLLALAALVLLLRERRAFAPGRPEWVRLRETGIYVVHLALVLGLLGFAASTYAQERAVFSGVPLGGQVAVGDYDIAIADPRAEAGASGLDALTVPLALAKHGAPVGREELAFEWRPGSAVYAGKLDVRRALAEDVYVRPMAFHTAQGWVGADSAAGAQVAPEGIDAVTFSVSVLPLMSLVWAATWMMVLGMLLILVASSRIPRAERH
ncbi:MAG TPA: cytochrome c biogenesis protein CcsA [Candidatus Thermoplasmatota archaeon]|nr:cytochrome c biogenesis protein CcsA [Candidatus Thermoplasmatota archaeon]